MSITNIFKGAETACLAKFSRRRNRFTISIAWRQPRWFHHAQQQLIMASRNMQSRPQSTGSRVPFSLRSVALALWLLLSTTCFWQAERLAQYLDREEESHAFRRAEVAAQAIEQVLGRVLEAVETLHELAQARQTLADAGDSAGVQVIEAQLAVIGQRGRFGVLQVAVIGLDGRLVWSSVSAWQPIYLGDREHFRAHLSRGGDLFVSEPLVGRASGRPSVQLSRRLSNKSGAFAGVAVVSIDPIELSQDLTAMQFGEGATALVARRDGVTLARSQNADRALSVRMSPVSPLLEALENAPAGHFRQPKSLYDGRPKLVAYRTLTAAPVVVAVGLDPAAELTTGAFARPVLRAAAAAISLLALATLGLALLWLEQRRTQADLDAARQEREAALGQLAHIQRMEALGRLAGGVAHDFNNVLQAVLGGTKGIARRSKDPAVQRLAGMVIEASERGASVTRRLLAFARRGELRNEVVNLPGLLAGVREVLTHTLGAEIRIRIEAESTLPSIVADRGQLETVLVNLAVNARDAMVPRGGGELTLSVEPTTIVAGKEHRLSLKSGKYVRLSVADTGTGMDAMTLARAAEPFFTTKPTNKGTGLGLAMAKGFAEQSGGGFQIESELGVGTTVTLWLPYADDLPKLAASAEARPKRPQEPSSFSVQRMRILLVDDEALVRETLAENLTALGWNVSAVENGAAALASIEKGEAIDLLITDLAMPGMDGLTLIRSARHHRAGLPALLMTGHTGDAHIGLLASAATRGPFALVRKPVSAEEVSSRAEMLISGLPEPPRQLLFRPSGWAEERPAPAATAVRYDG